MCYLIIAGFVFNGCGGWVCLTSFVLIAAVGVLVWVYLRDFGFWCRFFGTSLLCWCIAYCWRGVLILMF